MDEQHFAPPPSEAPRRVRQREVWNYLPPHCPADGQPKQNPTQFYTRPWSNCVVPIRGWMFRHVHDRNEGPIFILFMLRVGDFCHLPETMSCNFAFRGQYFLMLYIDVTGSVGWVCDVNTVSSVWLGTTDLMGTEHLKALQSSGLCCGDAEKNTAVWARHYRTSREQPCIWIDKCFPP